MKKEKIFSAMAGVLLAITAVSCEGEKDLIIIDGNLPIKTKTLYMVGDATPNGWNIGDPTPLTASEDDALVYSWQGELYQGEIKLCLVPGSWDVPFIRPSKDQREISSQNITDETFIMHQGDPDMKWRVTEAGKYLLSFNLRNWTMSTLFLGGAEAPTIEPIEAEEMFIVGSATPADWNIDAPTPLEKTGTYKFEYTGKLIPGEMKAYITTGKWDAPAIRPATGGVKINRNGVESEDFVYAASPDNKWEVEDAAIYHLTFDLENWKVAVEFIEEVVVDPLMDATEAYMIGSATEGGWDWGKCQVLSATSAEHVFTWTGNLYEGTFKCSVKKDFGAPALRPAAPEVVVDENGVADHTVVFTSDPDDQWKVVTPGKYTVTLDLNQMTIDVVYGGSAEPGPVEPEIPTDPTEPIEADALYIIGTATPCGWGIWAPTPTEKTGEYTFVYEGELVEGEMKALFKTGTDDWGQPFVRPEIDGCTISKNGAQFDGIVVWSEKDGPDQKWIVSEAGIYRLTFDLEHHTLTAEYLGANDYLFTKVLYMVGTATPGEWDLGKVTALTPNADNTVFTWTGNFNEGEMKACIVPDWGSKFLRPSTDQVEINEAGVAAGDFIYTSGDEGDNKWRVTRAGNYTVTFNLPAWTIEVKYND